MARLENLVDNSWDTLFQLLTRDTAAVACCVCREWNARFGARSRHLWAELVFDDAHFGVAVTEAVVRGACAKAGAALTCVTLPPSLLRCVPALCAVHPALVRVATPDGTVADTAALHALLCALPRVPAARMDVGLVCYASDVADGAAAALLSSPAVRLHTLRLLELHEEPWPWPGGYDYEAYHHTLPPTLTAARLLAAATSALTQQAAALVRLQLVRRAIWDDVAEQRNDDNPTPYRVDESQQGLVSAFVAALAACPRLRFFDLPRLLQSDAYERLALAVALACPALHSLAFDAEWQTQDGMAHLLPRLRSLRLYDITPGTLDDSYASSEDFLFPVLYRRWQDARQLEALELHCDDCMQGGFGADWMFDGLAASPLWQDGTLRCLTLEKPSAEVLKEAAKSLPHCGLTSLVLSPGDESERRREEPPQRTLPALQSLLNGVAAAPRLVRLDLTLYSYWSEEHATAVACLLGRPSAALRSLRLDGWPAGAAAARALGAALEANCTLAELTVGPACDELLAALADALARNTGLRRLTVRVTLPKTQHAPGVAAAAAATTASVRSVDALAARARTSSTLRQLRVVVACAGRDGPPAFTAREYIHSRHARGVDVGVDSAVVVDAVSASPQASPPRPPPPAGQAL